MSDLICAAASWFGTELDRCQPNDNNPRDAKQSVARNNEDNPEARSFLEKLLFGDRTVGGAVGCQSYPEVGPPLEEDAKISESGADGGIGGEDGLVISMDGSVSMDGEVEDGLVGTADGGKDGGRQMEDGAGDLGAADVRVSDAGIPDAGIHDAEVPDAAPCIPQEEICDGLDNDCDNEMDNEIAPLISYSGPPGTHGVGICRPEIRICEGGFFVTTQTEVLPQTEICNNINDNCNSETDEGIAPQVSYSGPEGTQGVGICRSEIRECRGGIFEVTRLEVLPQAETCDNLDNNCDGTIDDFTRDCYTGDPATRWVGECRDGTQICSAGSWDICVGDLLPQAEVCNNLDDDCNGPPDDGIASQVFYSGPPGTQDVGICQPEIRICAGGTFVVEQTEALPREEICNTLDDDCNGLIDDGLTQVTYSGPPGTQGVGICRPQILECIGGNFITTQAEILPQTEIIDGVDNDCNSAIDDGLWLQVSAGYHHTCGLRAEGTVECWGLNDYGQSTPPSGTFSQVSAGGWHTCGLRPDNTLTCWGFNDDGRSTPPSGTFSHLSVGPFHNCGIRTDNTTVCWGGSNDYGQSTPPSGTFIQFSAGGWHTCGLRPDNTLTCWGRNNNDQSTPPSETFVQVSAGGFHNCGIRTDNAVACWGRGWEGQSSPPPGTFSQVSAGYYHTCGLRVEGTVACWGDNGAGRATPPPGTFNQVSAGEEHTCGVRIDRTIACWGDNADGQSTPPSP